MRKRLAAVVLAAVAVLGVAAEAAPAFTAVPSASVSAGPDVFYRI